jgi:hypothetical protein
MMSNKKFYFLWFSPRESKFIRPQVEVEFGTGIRENLKDDIIVSMNSALPKWSSEFRARRALTVVTGLSLILMWAISLRSIQLGAFHYIAMGIFFGVALGALNFSFRSIFDVPDDALDERLYSLRNRYSFRSYQAIGLLILFILATVNFFELDPSRLWLPAIATYASVPYLFLGWQEKNFA